MGYHLVLEWGEMQVRWGGEQMEATIFDVAEYILRQRGPLPAIKLQKLCYYSNAWSLVWDDRPMFEQRFEAWSNGPVSPDLYAKHRRQYDVNAIAGANPENLDQDAVETITAVLDYYGDKSSQWLSDLTHMEEPWRLARTDIPDGERGDTVISTASIAEYFTSLMDEDS